MQPVAFSVMLEQENCSRLQLLQRGADSRFLVGCKKALVRKTGLNSPLACQDRSSIDVEDFAGNKSGVFRTEK
jgi:hypothetical protein